MQSDWITKSLEWDSKSESCDIMYIWQRTLNDGHQEIEDKTLQYMDILEKQKNSDKSRDFGMGILKNIRMHGIFFVHIKWGFGEEKE
jgi:hypothetical protein